jgi:MAF protein
MLESTQFAVCELFCTLMTPNLILASSSPRRKELLSLGSQSFQIAAADINEDVLPGEEPRAYVSRLAAEKARVAAHNAPAGSLVIAADTTVVHEGVILGKPADGPEAKAVLQALRGKEHLVYSAISVIRMDTGERLDDLAETVVPMRDYTEAEIDAYVATGNPLDKAGSYAIQHAGFHPVASMAGCYANVIGLPLCHLKRTLAKWNLSFDADLPAACQAFLKYDCPVTEEVLAWRL